MSTQSVAATFHYAPKELKSSLWARGRVWWLLRAWCSNVLICLSHLWSSCGKLHRSLSLLAKTRLLLYSVTSVCSLACVQWMDSIQHVQRDRHVFSWKSVSCNFQLFPECTQSRTAADNLSRCREGGLTCAFLLQAYLLLLLLSEFPTEVISCCFCYSGLDSRWTEQPMGCEVHSSLEVTVSPAFHCR